MRPDGRRLLVVADAPIADVAELPARARLLLDEATDVYVVTPPLPGRLAWLAWELNPARQAADDRLDAVLGQMREAGVVAAGKTGDDRMVTALSDAVREFAPNHILIALRSSDHSNWQERGLIEHIDKHFNIPITSFALDQEGHVTASSGS